MTKIALTIAGVDPSGGAGIVADIKTFFAFGVFPTSAISSITFQNTQGVFGAEHQSAESIRRQVEPILDDFDVAAVKTGMLPTREVIPSVLPRMPPCPRLPPLAPEHTSIALARPASPVAGLVVVRGVSRCGRCKHGGDDHRDHRRLLLSLERWSLQPEVQDGDPARPVPRRRGQRRSV